MLSKLPLFSALVVISSIAIAVLAIIADSTPTLSLCTGKTLQIRQILPTSLSQCIPFPADLKDKVRSLTVPQDTQCAVYEYSNCQVFDGATKTQGNIASINVPATVPAAQERAFGMNEWDQRITSVKCFDGKGAKLAGYVSEKPDGEQAVNLQVGK